MPKRKVSKKRANKKTILHLKPIYAVGIIILILIFVSISFFLTSKSPNKPTINAQVNQKSDITILHQVVNQLIEIEYKQNPKVAMDKLKGMLASNFISANCHAITHIIGNNAYIKYKSVSQALEYYDEMCGSGYIHGIIEQKFADMKSDAEVYQVLPTICAPQNTGICYHGVGHGFMWYSSDNLPQALIDCDNLITPYKINNCYDGVFMENFEGDHDVHPTKYINPQNPSYPCNQLDYRYKDSCYFYSARYYLQLYPNKYLQGFNWCRTLENGFQLTCIKGMGSAMMKQNLNNPNLVADYCNRTQSDDEKIYCIDGLVSYYLTNYYSYSKGLDMCDSIQDQDRQQCLNSLNNRKGLFPL